MCFWRWIADSFTALSRLSAIFAKHPAGVPPKADVLRAETVYLQYRDAYNSSLVWMELLCVQCTCMSSIGLASWALQERKLLYQVRPKMHALEHILLCNFLSCQLDDCRSEGLGFPPNQGESLVLPMHVGRRLDQKSGSFCTQVLHEVLPSTRCAHTAD